MGNWNATKDVYSNPDLSERLEIPQNCIMPEMPYCPSCRYGSVANDEESDGEFTEWVCLYDPKDPAVFAI